MSHLRIHAQFGFMKRLGWRIGLEMLPHQVEGSDCKCMLEIFLDVGDFLSLCWNSVIFDFQSPKVLEALRFHEFYRRQ